MTNIHRFRIICDRKEDTTQRHHYCIEGDDPESVATEVKRIVETSICGIIEEDGILWHFGSNGLESLKILAEIGELITGHVIRRDDGRLIIKGEPR